MFLIEKIMKILKIKIKKNVITVFIENNKRDITIKNDIKSLRTIIGILLA